MPGSFHCPACHKEYRWRRNLNRHMLKECGQDPSFNCPYCSYVSKYKSDLRRHCNRRHLGLGIGPSELDSGADAGHLGAKDDALDPLRLPDPALAQPPAKHWPPAERPAVAPVPVALVAAAPPPAPVGPRTVTLRSEDEARGLITTIAVTPTGQQIYVTTKAVAPP